VEKHCPRRCQVTKRTGWIRKGVQGPESIADHMYRMSMMALIANDDSVDQNRCVRDCGLMLAAQVTH